MTRTRRARFAVLAVLACAGASALVSAPASADIQQRYCFYCTMSPQAWDAHSSAAHSWDFNEAFDCSETGCGSWYTCVSMHKGTGSSLLLDRTCSSSGSVNQGYQNNWNTNAATAYCYNGSSSAHHMFCDTWAFGN
jgi:GH18 family chitinase